ncbi:MAG: hypothetical protein JST86_03915 [Bacteroidetes bacterium]|nr:hypothetical protein [Bacteroidota bacterium]
MRLFLIVIVSALLASSCTGNGTTADNKKDSAVNKGLPFPVLVNITRAKDIKVLLCQNWENKEDAQDAALSGDLAPGMPYRGFAFSRDGSMIQNPRDLVTSFGKWQLDMATKKITITYTTGGKKTYTIDYIDARKLVMENDEEKKPVEYQADGRVHKVTADDPFYAGNNQWRIKPDHAETNDEIKKRLGESLMFYSKYLNDQAIRTNSTLSVIGLPSIYLWYRRGVAVKTEKMMEDEGRWIQCFYSKEQANKAREMMEDIISRKYNWNANDSTWVKYDADMLHQIADTLAKTTMK